VEIGEEKVECNLSVVFIGLLSLSAMVSSFAEIWMDQVLSDALNSNAKGTSRSDNLGRFTSRA
jgi:hypothetical protein